jgi:hypothetical protein
MNDEAVLTWSQMMTSSDKIKIKKERKKRKSSEEKKNGFFLFLLSIE